MPSILAHPLPPQVPHAKAQHTPDASYPEIPPVHTVVPTGFPNENISITYELDFSVDIATVLRALSPGRAIEYDTNRLASTFRNTSSSIHWYIHYAMHYLERAQWLAKWKREQKPSDSAIADIENGTAPSSGKSRPLYCRRSRSNDAWQSIIPRGKEEL